MKHHLRTRPAASPTHHQGFSLIELMIGMVIGLILLLGVVTIFTSTQRVNNTEENLSRIQENARLAFDIMARDIRMAGNYGCLQDVDNLNSTLNTPNDFDWNFLIAIQGFTGKDNALPATVRDVIIPATDAIALRGVYGTGATLERLMPDTSADMKTLPIDPPPIGDNDIVIISDCVAATAFQVSNYTDANGNVVHNTGTGTPGNATKDLKHTYPPGSQVFKVATTTYYIAPSSTPNVRALWKYSAPAGVGTPIELIEGIHDMQIQYGEDTDGNQQANRYRTAAQNPNWANVVSVRINLLMRSERPVHDAPQTYTFNGAVTTANDRHMYQAMSYVVSLRNRITTL